MVKHQFAWSSKRHFTGRETVKHSTKNQNRSPGRRSAPAQHFGRPLLEFGFALPLLVCVALQPLRLLGLAVFLRLGLGLRLGLFSVALGLQLLPRRIGCRFFELQ